MVSSPTFQSTHRTESFARYASRVTVRSIDPSFREQRIFSIRIQFTWRHYTEKREKRANKPISTFISLNSSLAVVSPLSAREQRPI